MAAKTCIMLSLDFVGDRILPFFHCENQCFQTYHTHAVHNCRFGDYPEQKQDSVCRHYSKQSGQCGDPQARLFALRRAVRGNDVNTWLQRTEHEYSGEANGDQLVETI